VRCVPLVVVQSDVALPNHAVPEAHGAKGEEVRNGRVAARVVARVRADQLGETVAQDLRQPLLERDGLQLGSDNLPGLLRTRRRLTRVSDRALGARTW